ncbi:hypothetical protein [Sebaldella sp. S0638]|uniref:hypothetical protein n=1 Tax=Sebaldella sp. S0638 TaxID=2957809 RepID=UPI00209C7BD6|nr:hypothetical protein [Sebaldella sp. S0638]
MRKFFKWELILAALLLMFFMLFLNERYENEKRRNDKRDEFLNDYDGVSFIKYKPTLFTIYNRGGFEINNNIDNLIYEKEPDMDELREAVNETKMQEKIVLDTGDQREGIKNISCQVDMKLSLFSMNDCLSVFSKITDKRLKYLKKIELNNIRKQISYNFSGTDKSFWNIKIADNRYYEIRFSEIHRVRIQEVYKIQLPEKIYGILTEDQYKILEKLNIEKITADDDEGLRELWDIFPFINFSYRYKDVVDAGKMN